MTLDFQEAYFAGYLVAVKDRDAAAAGRVEMLAIGADDYAIDMVQAVDVPDAIGFQFDERQCTAADRLGLLPTVGDDLGDRVVSCREIGERVIALFVDVSGFGVVRQCRRAGFARVQLTVVVVVQEDSCAG